MRSRDSIVYTPVSLGPDTDDEETLVNVEVYKNGESYIKNTNKRFPRKTEDCEQKVGHLPVNCNNLHVNNV